MSMGDPEWKEKADAALDKAMVDHYTAKKDQGKPMAACILDFARALSMVARISTFGAMKYARGSWVNVPNARQRYEDAMIRHLLASKIERLDPESGEPHMAHFAWNALAILELDQREEVAKSAPTEKICAGGA